MGRKREKERDEAVRTRDTAVGMEEWERKYCGRYKKVKGKVVIHILWRDEGRSGGKGGKEGQRWREERREELQSQRKEEDDDSREKGKRRAEVDAADKEGAK